MSERQRETNRINGAKGGPKTPEGKAISAQNARRHSLTAKKLVLNSEDEDLFNGMTDGYMEMFQPANLEEIDLIREIVSGKWRQERWSNIEAAMIDLSEKDAEPAIKEEFSQIEPEVKIAFALIQQHGVIKALGLVNLYESRMCRLHVRARRDLERLQAARTPKETKPSKPVRLAPVPEVVEPTPISYRSFISEEERDRLTPRKNKLKIDLDLPEKDPQDHKKGPREG